MNSCWLIYDAGFWYFLAVFVLSLVWFGVCVHQGAKAYRKTRREILLHVQLRNLLR